MTFRNQNEIPIRELASRATNMRVTTGAENLPERLKMLFFLLREKRSDRPPSHIYGNPIGWIKCLKMVVHNFFRGIVERFMR